jgi:hypothetical protein
MTAAHCALCLLQSAFVVDHFGAPEILALA